MVTIDDLVQPRLEAEQQASTLRTQLEEAVSSQLARVPALRSAPVEDLDAAAAAAVALLESRRLSAEQRALIEQQREQELEEARDKRSAEEVEGS